MVRNTLGSINAASEALFANDEEFIDRTLSRNVVRSNHYETEHMAPTIPTKVAIIGAG